ncbi:MAG: glycine cleavage system aminomethyltransferase GcvT [Clostridia bacterium]|jgi:aminomethyltransferase|nr:glycine cleavage system aminomethyltransferase GcvT [Clostridia bacterium]
MSTRKRTILYPQHVQLGAKIAEFAGWDMPIQYQSVIEEHHAVRTKAGLFDISHMGEIEVSGPDALTFLQRLCTNDLAKMCVGQVLYTLMCYPTGGIVDDLLVYRLEQDKYWLVVNAGNKDKDWDWINEQLTLMHREEQEKQTVELRDISDEIGLLALQGPLAQQILASISIESLEELRYYRFIFTNLAGVDALVSRTGYTGEDGFELYLPVEKTPFIWEKLLETGKDAGLGLVPVGLGARDTLRFEAGLPLYGHELTEKVTPLEAGLEFFIAWQKDDFIGKAALLKQKEEGVSSKLVGFMMIERGIPRAGYPLIKDGESIGEVTSGSFAPTLGQNLGLGFVVSKEAFIDNEISVLIRGKEVKAKVTKKPFYKREVKK